MSKRPSISSEFLNQIDESPIDLLTKPTGKQQAKEFIYDSKAKQSKQPEKQGTIALKEKMTIQISKDTIERAKNTVYWTPGLTIAQLIEEALNLVLNKMEKQRGEPFPQRKA